MLGLCDSVQGDSSAKTNESPGGGKEVNGSLDSFHPPTDIYKSYDAPDCTLPLRTLPGKYEAEKEDSSQGIMALGGKKKKKRKTLNGI